jgi:hypothetical protein
VRQRVCIPPIRRPDSGGRSLGFPYCPLSHAGTKFAREAVTDSLRRQIAPLGAQVDVVEPAAGRTKIGDRAIAGP